MTDNYRINVGDNYYYINARKYNQLMKHAIKKDDKKSKAILSCTFKNGDTFKIDLDKVQEYFKYSINDVRTHIDGGII